MCRTEGEKVESRRARSLTWFGYWWPVLALAGAALLYSGFAGLVWWIQADAHERAARAAQEFPGDEVQALLMTASLHPMSISQVSRELWLQQALAREAGGAALERALPAWNPGPARPYRKLLPLCDTILVSGGVLRHAPRLGQAALIALDAVQPIGITTLVLDRYGLLPLLGAAGEVKPLASVEVMDSGGLVKLATVIAPVSRGRRGELLLNLRVTYEDGGSFSAEARQGDLEVVPLPPGQQALLELRPARHVDIGLGGPGRGGKRQVTGGAVGLIIDARGRPVPLADDADLRRRQIRRWLLDLGG